MKRCLKVTFSRKTYLYLDIPDGELAENEIEAKVIAAIAAEKQSEDEFDYAWLSDKPLTREDPEPPPECWFEIDGVHYATNAHIVITKNSPRLTKITTPWATVSSALRARVEKLIKQSCGELVPHTGWFDPALVNPLLGVDDIKVLCPDSKPYNPGFFMANGVLLAVVAPCTGWKTQGLIKPNP